MRDSSFLALTLVIFTVAVQAETACLSTLPNNPAFAPPAPYDAWHLSAGTFWYGTDALWTALDVDGTWHIKNNSDQRGGYVTKLVFWRRGFDWRKEPNPDLIVTARRIDGDAPSIAVAHANAVFVTGNTPAMMTGIRFPKGGCWEVSGHYGGQTLTFIVSLAE